MQEETRLPKRIVLSVGTRGIWVFPQSAQEVLDELSEREDKDYATLLEERGYRLVKASDDLLGDLVYERGEGRHGTKKGRKVRRWRKRP
ncbi:MAG: hypothetical protein QXR87_04965 [Candidatus Hadarchaeales archaeon]